MATKVHMEALSPTMEEGQVVKWLKKQGDDVASGDVLAEIETDKATMELVARGDGVLRAIFVDEGGVVPVGEVIGVIAGADEDIEELIPAGAGAASGPAGDGSSDETSAAEPASSAGSSEAAAASPQASGSESSTTAPAPGAQPRAEEGTAAPAAPSGNGRVKASPLARRLAEEAGVDLAAVSGSGPGGRVVKKDIEAALAAGPDVSAAPAAPAARPASTVQTDGPEFEDIPLTQIRKTIARRLTESLGPVPHFFLNIHVDMTRVMDARRRINDLLEPQGEKVSINDMIVRATATALTRHPECNAHWMGDRIRRFHRAHIGIAVAVEDGLITPVVRDAHLKGVAQIGREVKDMAARAREKRLMPDEYTGSTFSISNLGMFGIYEFTAVINPPEAGILAIGGIEQWPVPNGDDGFRFVPRMKITMSCDHRVIDGATGARFLQTLKGMLEEPVSMLV